VVAYLNEDDVANGVRFVGAASPSLKPFIRDVTRAVADPDGRGTVYDAWLASTAGDTAALRLDNLGGGSDFAAFSHHLGIAAASVGFGGPSGVYHSMYDSFAWMSRFGDPGYRAHRAAAQLLSIAAARLANAEVLPFDFVALGTELTVLAQQIDSEVARRNWRVATAALPAALAQLTAAAQVFATVRDSALVAGLAPASAAQANRWLMQVERSLTRQQGLAGRPWYRSLQFAPDVDNGYSTMAFPSINEAIRYADAATTEREISELVAHVDQSRGAIERATAALR
jgi:N-acetylated-alpha-linked acidic dipeptidase